MSAMVTTKVAFYIELAYDPDQLTEHEAQKVALEGFPEIIRDGSQVVTVAFAERTHGGVDKDGVPDQPRAERPGRDKRRDQMTSAPEPRGVRVGVAAVIENAGRLLALRRQGSHGAGTWGLPGGHQELGEAPAETAVRETFEETGVTVEATQPLGFTDDQMLEVGKHYVTLFMQCRWLGGEPKILEPEKASAVAWFSPAELRSMGDRVFGPLRRFLDEHPEIGTALGAGTSTQVSPSGTAGARGAP